MGAILANRDEALSVSLSSEWWLKSLYRQEEKEPSQGNPLKLYFLNLALKEHRSSWKRSHLKMPYVLKKQVPGKISLV